MSAWGNCVSERSGRLGLLAGEHFRIVLVDLGPNLGDDRVEGLGIVDGELREALAVQADFGEAQAVYQAGCNARRASRRRRSAG